jgi:hypothetical protein
MAMSPFEETFTRVTTLLDEPDAHTNLDEIRGHLDTLIDYSANDEERRAAYDFKAMALNHMNSIGRDRPEVTEEKRVRALRCVQVISILVARSRSQE